MNITYIPTPINTSDIELSSELKQLTEQMARNVHDIWALGRFNDGWTYGLERNDNLKKHPCLVDYDELPESEKEYDRNTAIETLKLILKLGWKIEKK
ncbi:MAG: Ryanodine receptor Ryr [Bacteroidales bacterium]|nr:Ryanodine receptor Ryr [Bacteroidales bacterium]